MTDNEIVKALECCRELSDCGGCRYGYLRTRNGLCIYSMQSDALDLINRQKAEIERLKEAYAVYEETTGLKWARAEAIKEFAERIEPELANNTEISSVGYQSIIAIIINLVKEMTEETP